MNHCWEKDDKSTPWKTLQVGSVSDNSGYMNALSSFN